MSITRRFTDTYNDLRVHAREPMYLNAYALILNTGVTSVLGIIALAAAANLYSLQEVGENGALVAAMLLLSAVTQLNLASVLMRFMPRAGSSARLLLTASYGASALCAVVVTTMVLLIANLVTSGHVLNMSIGLGTIFVLSVVAYSIFNLQDAALTGLRRSIWLPLENGVFGVAKIAALFIFAGFGIFGSLGIFASWAVLIPLTLIPVNYALYRRFLPAHAVETQPKQVPLDRPKIIRYIAGDYPGSLFVQASTTLMPLVVVTSLGPVATAYFYIAQSISTATDLMVTNLSQSFTVEASNDESRTAMYARAVLKHMFKLVVPVVAIVIVLAPWIMSVMGEEYRNNATDLVRLMTLASIPRIFAAVYGGLARLEHKTHRIAVMTAVQAVVLISASLILMPRIGVVGVGVASLLSQAATAAIAIPRLVKTLRV